MSIVISVAPAFFPMQEKWLGGELWSPGSGNTRIKLSYPNIPGYTYTKIGRDRLNTLLTTYAMTQHVIVGGHSQGAQVIAMWLRDIGYNSDIPEENLTCYLTGNLERKYNGHPKGGDYPGLVKQPVGGRYETDPGGSGIPEDIKYEVFDIAKQWDGWADNPTDTTNKLAMDNAFYGKLMGSCHTQYDQVLLNDPDMLVHKEYNITYMLAPSYPLPLAVARFKSQADINAYHEEHVEEVESAYDRPYSSAVEQPGPAPLPPIPTFPAGIPSSGEFVDRRVYDLTGDSK